MTPSNAELAEMLTRASETQEGNKRRALRRAGHAALTWTEEAADVARANEDLTDLRSVGPWIANFITALLADPPELPEPPPQRQGFGTLAAARGLLQSHSEWRRNLLGDLQMHTTYSDGRLSIDDMAAACSTRGYSYMAVTDHSKGLKIAGGMDEAQLDMQGGDIERVNASLADGGAALKVLKGIEMNLDPAGEGDMEPEALARLDIVLGSFHSQLRVTEDQTERYLAGLRNPHVSVLGHPRCRMWDRRVGLRADWKRVFSVAAELDKAIETDAHANRQDIDVGLLEIARDCGVRISIGTDAHDDNELGHVEIGLAAALRAGIPKNRILNFMPVDDLVAWSRAVRS